MSVNVGTNHVRLPIQDAKFRKMEGHVEGALLGTGSPLGATSPHFKATPVEEVSDLTEPLI